MQSDTPAGPESATTSATSTATGPPRGRSAPPRRRTQAERSAGTRAAVLAAARLLFGRQGYAATGREDIAAAAGVTRGALYHHFTSKAEVFSAVIEVLDDELVRRVMDAARSSPVPALEALRVGARAYIEACAEPDIARILVEAPSVLGFETYRRLSAQSCQMLLRAALEAIGRELGPLPAHPEVLAPLLLALLNEAACMVALTPGRSPRMVTEAVDQVLSLLLTASRTRPPD